MDYQVELARFVYVPYVHVPVVSSRGSDDSYNIPAAPKTKRPEGVDFSIKVNGMTVREAYYFKDGINLCRTVAK